MEITVGLIKRKIPAVISRTMESSFSEPPSSDAPPAEPSLETTSLEPVPGESALRVELSDENGTPIGYRLISQSDFEQWSEDFDLSDRRVRWSYSNNDGFEQAGSCSTLLDDHGEPIGERWLTRSLSPSGAWDSSIDTYDLSGNLLSSTFSNSDGLRTTWLRTTPAIDSHPSGIPVAYGLIIEEYLHDVLQFSSVESYSSDGLLLASSSSSADGSSTRFDLHGLLAEDGSISGYEGIWVHTDADGQVSTWSDDQGTSLDKAGSPWLQRTTVGDSDGAPAVEEPCIWLPPAEEPFTAEVQSDPVICEALPQQSFEAVMSTTGSPLLFNAPVTTGGRTVREDSRDLNLRKRQHEGARNGELTGSRNLNLIGNRFDNELTGNDGNNRIFGGRGIDRCSGGAGLDSFVLIARRGSHHDWLTDFDPEDDKLLLRGRGLRRLFSEGELRQGVLGDSLIWNEQDKALLFDPDGATGARSPIMLAIIPGLQAQNVTADLFLPG